MTSQNEPCEIKIDKEGIWHFRGAVMIRQDIVNYFYQHLKADGDGYCIEIGDQRCSVEVEDVPFIIKSAELSHSQGGNDNEPSILLSLSDESTEMLNLDKSLRMGKDNVLYCRVKKDRFEARFSRPAYYQLCKYIDYDATGEAYALNLDHCSIPINFYQ